MQKYIVTVCLILCLGICASGQDNVSVSLVSDSIKSGIRISGLSQFDNLEIRKAGVENVLWGSFTRERKELIFYPRVTFISNVDYELIRKSEHTIEILKVFQIDKERVSRSKPSVKNIYPLTSALPENLLRFHIEFSESMSSGNVFDHISLINKTKGQIVNNAFVRTKYELWSDGGKVLTLYLDPGRIKTGLSLNKALGLPLQSNNQYDLIIDADWRDVFGAPLGEDVIKKLEIRKRVNERISAENLNFIASDSLITIDFDRTINHFNIQSFIKVFAEGVEVEGGWKTSRNSKVHFIPVEKIASDTCIVRVSSELEDVSGNSFRRSFEEPHGTVYKEQFTIEKTILISINSNKKRNEKTVNTDHFLNDAG